MGVLGGLILKPTSQIPRNGLVAEYLANNNFLDTSGNAFNGVNNNVTFGPDRNSNPNSAFVLPNSTVPIDTKFIDVPHVIVTGTPLTISAWVKTSVVGVKRIVAIHDRATDDNILSLVINVGGCVEAQHFTSSTSSVATSTTLIDTNVWTHVLGVFNSVSRREIFVSGVSEDVNTDTRDAISGIDYTGIGYIDFSTFGDIQHWDGELDDIRIYNRVLSQAEITILANE